MKEMHNSGARKIVDSLKMSKKQLCIIKSPKSHLQESGACIKLK